MKYLWNSKNTKVKTHQATPSAYGEKKSNIKYNLAATIITLNKYAKIQQ